MFLPPFYQSRDILLDSIGVVTDRVSLVFRDFIKQLYVV